MPATIPRPPGFVVSDPSLSEDPLRLEVACTAARLIAESGLDYASAKRQALDEVLDGGVAPRGVMPDNAAIDQALAEHLALFDPAHPARVARMRRVALAMMQSLEPFQPYLTGSVWKGIVAAHAPIHIQCFHDNAKEVGMQLIDKGIDYEAAEVPHFRQGNRQTVEALQMTWQAEPLQICLYATDDLRGALRASPPERGNLAAVQALLAATPSELLR